MCELQQKKKKNYLKIRRQENESEKGWKCFFKYSNSSNEMKTKKRENRSEK